MNIKKQNHHQNHIVLIVSDLRELCRIDGWRLLTL
jgi:hypothetical protein